MNAYDPMFDEQDLYEESYYGGRVMSRIEDLTVREETIGKYVARVVHDEDPYTFSPREWENLGSLIALERWSFADDHQRDMGEAWRAAQRGDVCIAIPVYIDTRGSQSSIDSTTDWTYANGLYWVSWDRARRGWGKDAGGAFHAHELAAVRIALMEEIKTLDAWMRGETYGWVVTPVEDPEDVLESVWGYVGETNSPMKEARQVARAMEEARVTRWSQVPEWMREQVLAWMGEDED